jgi:hypothetical protein
LIQRGTFSVPGAAETKVTHGFIEWIVSGYHESMASHIPFVSMLSTSTIGATCGSVEADTSY